MKTESFDRPRWLVRVVCEVCALLTFGLLICKSNGQTTLIDFENIPPVYTPVDNFGGLLPGVTLTSGGQWIADELNSWYFENMYGRAISAFPDGSAPLSIRFNQPARDVRMDLGSSWIGGALTISVTGYRDNQALFSDTFTTHVVAGGADEVRAQTFGTVDNLVVARTAGDAHLILDNLSFVTVPEPQAISLILAGVLLGTLRMIPKQTSWKRKPK